MCLIAILVLSEDSPKLKWSHAWFFLVGVVLTLCIEGNMLCRFCTHLATMVDRGAGTDAGLNSDLESQGGGNTATSNVPAWVGRRLLMRRNGWRQAIESV